MLLLSNYHLCCCSLDFLRLQQCHLLFRFVFLTPRFSSFLMLIFYNGRIFFRFRVVSTLVGTAITLPFQSRVLELVLPDGVGSDDEFYIMLGFLVVPTLMSRLGGVTPGWIIKQVAFFLMPSNTGLSFIASHLNTLLMYTIG